MSEKIKDVPLCASVSPDLKDMANAEATRFRKTVGGITSVALQNLFALKPAERERMYKKVPAKILGRPVDS